MDDKDRFRRSEPLRDRPIRDAAGHLRGVSPEAQIVDSVVTEAVGLGYDVIDTYIRQGRFAAEQARAGIDASGLTSDIAGLAQRAVTLSIDLAKSWLDLVTAVNEQCKQAHTKPNPVDPYSVPTEYDIICARPTQVEFQFYPGAGRIVPAILSLAASDASIPPLTGASFTVSQDGKRPALNIPVTDGQPAGVYTGVIVDSVTNRPGGTVVVRILS